MLSDKLPQAYQKLLKALHQDLEAAKSNYQTQLGVAKDTIRELEHLTDEEVDLVADSLTRDLHDAMDALKESGQALGDLWALNWSKVEGELGDIFRDLADQIQLEQIKLAHRLERGQAYRTGELMGPGRLQCEKCGEVLHFHGVKHIPPCGGCHGSVFSRVTA